MIGPFDFKPSLLGRVLTALARGMLPALVDGGFGWVDVRDAAAAATLVAVFFLTAPCGRHARAD